MRTIYYDNFSIIVDDDDNCQHVPNTDQTDSDGDDFGDACDNCRFTAQNNQKNNDNDEAGEACDADDNNDTIGEFKQYTMSCTSDTVAMMINQYM